MYLKICLIVILLERKGAAEPCYTNAHLRNVHWKGIFKFLEGKCRHIFESEKPRLTMVNNEWLYGLDLAE